MKHRSGLGDFVLGYGEPGADATAFDEIEELLGMGAVGDNGFDPRQYRRLDGAKFTAHPAYGEFAFFVAGTKTTLPIYVFSSIQRGVTPEINAVATIVLCVSLAAVFSAQALLGRQKGKSSRN